VLGDAAGFIPPISGNGMSLAFRSANEIAPGIVHFLRGEKDLEFVLETNLKYNKYYLNSRINKGIQLQKLILNSSKMIKRAMFVCFRLFPRSLKFLSKKAVGRKIESSI
jgi:flavin-dependent dehydrogenase